VKVIVQECVREEPPAAAQGHARQQSQPVPPVLLVTHDVSAFQASIRDVVDTVGNLKSQGSWHGTSIRTWGQALQTSNFAGAGHVTTGSVLAGEV
jgi:hypothetical protein